MTEKRPCPDCGVELGCDHEPGCDVERCRLCGGQAISCSCPDDDAPYVGGSTIGEATWLAYLAQVDAVGGRVPWTGDWPGEAECREFGWYSKLIPGRGWVRCDKDDPEASEDLNRLHHGECEWDVERGRFVLVPRHQPLEK